MLAIIIPSYNIRFLNDALSSLKKQTNKNFTVYIGDDNGPSEIKDICDNYSDKLDIIYKRFDENMGQVDLVGQWNRSVNLRNEKWVWLLSDDDLAENRCVEYFYKALDKTKGFFSVFRFNTLLINENSKIIDVSPSHATLETPMEFALYRLQGNRHGCISNIIFSRDSFERENGFVNFPFGWYADDASILAFAGDKEIYTISGPRIKYRISWGKNVSSQKSFRKIDALFQYRDWLNDRFINTSYPELGLNIDMINKTAKKWFLNNIIILEGMPYLKILSVSRKLNNIYHNGIIKNFILLILLNLFTSFIGSLKLLKKYLIAT